MENENVEYEFVGIEELSDAEIAAIKCGNPGSLLLLRHGSKIQRIKRSRDDESEPA